jgi:hypothetical protein
MKDLIGMLGGMLFSLLQGSHFDADAKQWRFFADIANNVGLGLELAAPLFPGYFLAVICAGSMCRALTGVAAGATRASLTSHFAREANAADIAAKEASQETCVTLLGMCVGLALGRLVEAAPYCVWPVFLALTALHVVANAKAVRSLRITSLNRERTRLLLQHYQRTVRASSRAARVRHAGPRPNHAHGCADDKTAWVIRARRCDLTSSRRWRACYLGSRYRHTLGDGAFRGYSVYVALRYPHVRDGVRAEVARMDQNACWTQ